MTDQPVGRSSIADAAVLDAAVLDAAVLDAAVLGDVASFDTPDSSLVDLVVVGDLLAWTDTSGSLYAMPARGGRAIELANQHDGDDRPMYAGLVQHRGVLYAAKLGGISKVALPSGPVTPWQTGGDRDRDGGSDRDRDGDRDGEDAYALASDGTSLYLALMNGKLDRVGDDGARTTVMRTYQGLPAMGSDAMYVSDFSLGTVAKLSPKPSPKPRVIARGIPMLAAFAVAGRWGFAYSQRDDLVHRVELATGRVSALWPDKLAAGHLYADGDWLYTFTPDDAFVRIASDGHELQVLADHVHEAPIASDADAIYVAGDGVIMRFDKTRIAPLRVNVAR